MVVYGSGASMTPEEYDALTVGDVLRLASTPTVMFIVTAKPAIKRRNAPDALDVTGLPPECNGCPIMRISRASAANVEFVRRWTDADRKVIGLDVGHITATGRKPWWDSPRLIRRRT